MMKILNSHEKSAISVKTGPLGPLRKYLVKRKVLGSFVGVNSLKSSYSMDFHGNYVENQDSLEI